MDVTTRVLVGEEWGSWAAAERELTKSISVVIIGKLGVFLL
jgi:hypothetical protein